MNVLNFKLAKPTLLFIFIFSSVSFLQAQSIVGTWHGHTKKKNKVTIEFSEEGIYHLKLDGDEVSQAADNFGDIYYTPTYQEDVINIDIFLKEDGENINFAVMKAYMSTDEEMVLKLLNNKGKVMERLELEKE